MEAFSIIQIPEYIKKKLARSKIGLSIDYKRFNLKSHKILDNLLLNAHRANDCDNSNVAYDGEVSYMRIHSPRWIAHKVVLSIENVWPVPFAYIEVYGVWQGLAWSVAKIDFYGAFFHFIDVIPRRYLHMYRYLQDLSEEKNLVRVTRIDVAMDFLYDFPQNAWDWIVPSENSEREVSAYKHKRKYNSYGYLSKNNSGYGVRMYNKSVEVKKDGKINWYWWEDKIPENWTRIEFEFYPPYSLKNDDELMMDCWKKVVGRGKVELWLQFRPTYQFKVENAYVYFMRYARTHWVSMESLIDEVVAYHIKMEKIQEAMTWQGSEDL